VHCHSQTLSLSADPPPPNESTRRYAESTPSIRKTLTFTYSATNSNYEYDNNNYFLLDGIGCKDTPYSSDIGHNFGFTSEIALFFK
jgi:hypothetical protein